jgi:DNA-binding response OmpR family regulator
MLKRILFRQYTWKRRVVDQVRSSGSVLSQQPSVLLVTYNDDERQLYGDALEQAAIAVIHLSDPHEALRLATQPPTAMVTRILQPGYSMDGIELTRAIKGNDSIASVPVIIITSLLQPEHRVAALAAGCDEYLLLPVLPDELVGAVKRVVGR